MFRRRRRQNDVADANGGVAGEASASFSEGLDSAIEQADLPEPARQPRRSRRRSRIAIRWPVLAVLIVVIAGLVFLAAGGAAGVPPEVLARWPWLLVIGGAVWLLVSLVTGWPRGALGGPLVIAIGLVALLQQQGFASNMMVIGGALMVALGAGVILRGFTMPHA